MKKSDVFKNFFSMMKYFYKINIDLLLEKNSPKESLRVFRMYSDILEYIESLVFLSKTIIACI